MLVTIWYSRGHCRSSWLNSLPPYLASFFSWLMTLSVVLLKQLAAVLGFTFFMDHLVSSVGIGSNKQSDFSSFTLWSVLVTRLTDLHGLTFSSISTLSVVLVKQLAAVPGLTLLLMDFYSVGRLVETACRCTWPHLLHGSLHH